MGNPGLPQYSNSKSCQSTRRLASSNRPVLGSHHSEQRIEMQTTSLAKQCPLFRRTLSQLPRITRIGCSFLLVLCILGNAPAAGWWTQVHSFISENSIAHLPQPLRGFFEENVSAVSALAAQEPSGAHYINMDVYPEFFAGTFPRDIDDLISIYGVSFVNRYGKGPWTFTDFVETLTTKMASATDEQDWLNLLPIAVAQAHYIQDLHNPLHLTLNFNGQLTGNSGIHARYEGQMIVRQLNEFTFVQTDAVYLPSVIDFVFDGIDSRYPLVANILAADDLHSGLPTEEYYAEMWNDTGAFTQVLFQQASEAVANSWYTAWINAGSPTTFLEVTADFDSDGDVDAQDLSRWELSYGFNNLADADFDGDSDGADFLAWQRQYTVAMVNVSVPEPASIVLLATAAVSRLLRLRKVR